MPSPSFLEFAEISNAAYYAAGAPTTNFTRVHYGQLASGFKASRYDLANGSSPFTVVAFAGTDSSETEQTDSPVLDVLSDVGFSGATVAGVVGAISPGLGLVAAAGARQLEDQITGAVEFTRQAQYFAGSRGTVYVTGHSLGGGLAQIIAAQMDLRGVAFNAPTVSQMRRGTRAPDQFYNINQRLDPVSGGTSVIGNHLGSVIQIDSGAGIADAHFLGPVIEYLRESAGSRIGRRRPFG